MSANKQIQEIKDLHNNFPDEGQEIAALRQLARKVIKYTLEQAANIKKMGVEGYGGVPIYELSSDQKMQILFLESQIFKDLQL